MVAGLPSSPVRRPARSLCSLVSLACCAARSDTVCGQGCRQPRAGRGASASAPSAARARPVLARAARRPSRRAGKLRMLAGACGPAAYGRRDAENSVTLTPASGARSAAVATSLPTWWFGATSLPTWWFASQIRGLAWRSQPARCLRSEPARLQPARRAGAARLPGGARAPCGPGTRRRRHTRQSLRARPTPRDDEQARGSTRPCRFQKRARRGGHLHPPWLPLGRPVLP